MLTVIDSITHPYYSWIASDPVRPEIPSGRHIAQDCSVFAWPGLRGPASILCCRYTSSVPDSVDSLFADQSVEDTAVFYSIWSIEPGSARSLIESARAWIIESRPNIVNFITLSPPTDQARLFHLRNGAEVYRINHETINYRYESRKN